MNKAEAKEYAWGVVYDVLNNASENGTIDQKVDEVTDSGSEQQKIVDAVGVIIGQIWKKG